VWGTGMLRNILCVAFLVSGCAIDQPAPIVRTKIVKEYIREPNSILTTQTCTVTTRPMTKQELCGMGEKTCPQIATCGEAYYRYTTCGEIERDSGVPGVRNGIPCEKVCGKTPLAMAAKIRSEPPFSPPPKSIKTCEPG
jgi:hypothetical protein